MRTDKLNLHKMSTMAFLTAALLGLGTLPASAQDDKWSLDSLVRKPLVKQAAVGAAVGAAGGALSDRTSVGRGAAVGALSGVGTGLVSQSRFFHDKPLLRNTVQGAIVGTGASYALGTSPLKGAAVGAGGGAGYHYIRRYFDQR